MFPGTVAIFASLEPTSVGEPLPWASTDFQLQASNGLGSTEESPNAFALTTGSTAGVSGDYFEFDGTVNGLIKTTLDVAPGGTGSIGDFSFEVWGCIWDSIGGLRTVASHYETVPQRFMRLYTRDTNDTVQAVFSREARRNIAVPPRPTVGLEYFWGLYGKDGTAYMYFGEGSTAPENIALYGSLGYTGYNWATTATQIVLGALAFNTDRFDGRLRAVRFSYSACPSGVDGSATYTPDSLPLATS